MSGDPFEFASGRIERMAEIIHVEVVRLAKLPACKFCGFTYVHAHDCLDRMNRVRAPTGDWWKL